MCILGIPVQARHVTKLKHQMMAYTLNGTVNLPLVIVCHNQTLLVILLCG